MATDVIIKFYSGTAQSLDALTNNKATCIGFQTDTGRLFWKLHGNKLYLKVNWDDISEGADPYPEPMTQLIQSVIDSYLPSYSFTQIARQDKQIDPTQVTVNGQGTQKTFTFATSIEARPCWLKTSSSLYSIQPESVSIQSDNTLNIELSRYMSYQNTTQVPYGWKLCYR